MTDMPDPVKVAAGVNEDDAMKMANDLYYKENPGQTRRAGSYEGCIIAAAATLGARAMQDAMAGRVRVKALEWGTWPADGSTSSVVGYPRRYRRLRALTKIGAYFINEGLGVGDEPHFYVDLSGAQIWDGDTLEEATAAAQDDYQRRISSALEPAGAQEGATADTRLNAVTGGLDYPAALATKQPADSRSDPALGTAREAPDMAGDKVGVSTLVTPAPDVPGLVERARNAQRNITGRLRDAGWQPTRAGIESARNHIRDLADALEALQARLARKKALISALDDDRKDITKRATAAEAERDALRAEVERKDKALRGAFDFVAGVRGAALALAMSGKDNPKLDGALMRLHDDGLTAEGDLRAALLPAKAGG